MQLARAVEVQDGVERSVKEYTLSLSRGLYPSPGVPVKEVLVVSEAVVGDEGHDVLVTLHLGQLTQPRLGILSQEGRQCSRTK